MSLETILTTVLIASLTVAAERSVRITRGSERLIVLRFGRFHRLVGPGVSFLIPGIDRAVRTNLDKAIPHWRSLSQEELRSRVEELLRRPVSPPR